MSPPESYPPYGGGWYGRRHDRRTENGAGVLRYWQTVGVPPARMVASALEML